MPSWNDFQRKHVLSPEESSDCLSWNRLQWNVWMKNRLPNEFGNRRVNSIVFASPADIVRDYENLNHGFSKPEFYWSNRLYKVFALTIDHNLPSDSPYRVYNFGEMYILVKISRDPNVPVHFEAQNTSRPSSGRPNINFSDYNQIL